MVELESYKSVYRRSPAGGMDQLRIFIGIPNEYNVLAIDFGPLENPIRMSNSNRNCYKNI